MSRSTSHFRSPAKSPKLVGSKPVVDKVKVEVTEITNQPSMPFSPQSKKISLGSKEDDLVDFNEYPSEVRQATANDINIQYTLGDLHGSWISYIWQLIKLGVINLSKAGDLNESKNNYQELKNAYLEMEALFDDIKKLEKKICALAVDSESSESDELFSSSTDDSDSLKSLLNEFNNKVENLSSAYDDFSKQIKKINVINKDLRIAKVGDDYGDRNGCDVCMLDLDAILIDLAMRLDKLYGSNHSFDFFVNAICRKFKLADRQDLCLFDTILVSTEDDGFYNASLHNLGRFIRAGISSDEKLHDKVVKYLLPRLCIVDFIRDKNKNESKTFGTHAPNTSENLEFIKSLFKYFKVECDFKNSKSIETAVLKVNKRFRKWIQKKSFEDIYTEIHREIHGERNPVWKAMCNRDISEVKTEDGVFHIFGHCLRILGMSETLQEAYQGIDNEAIKLGSNREEGRFNKARLHAVATTSSATPKDIATNEGVLDKAEEVVKPKKLSFGNVQSMFNSPVKSTKPKKNEQEPLLPNGEGLHPNITLRRGRGAANQ